MHHTKILSFSLLTTLLVVTGCTQTQTVSNINDSTEILHHPSHYNPVGGGRFHTKVSLYGYFI